MIEPHVWFDDPGPAVDWYEAVLGFEVVASHPDESPTWFQLARGDVRVMVAVTPPEAQTVDSQAYLAAVTNRLAGAGAPVALYLHTDDAAAEHGRAVAAGTEIIEPLWDPWWGGRQFTVCDPAGTWWTVYQSEIEDRSESNLLATEE